MTRLTLRDRDPRAERRRYHAEFVSFASPRDVRIVSFETPELRDYWFMDRLSLVPRRYWTD